MQGRIEARNFLGYFVWKITISRQKILFFPIPEEGAKIVGVFRVKNHDFMQKNHIFSNFRGGGGIFGPRYIGDDFLLGPRYINRNYSAILTTLQINRNYSAILATLQITSYVHSRNSS